MFDIYRNSVTSMGSDDEEPGDLGASSASVTFPQFPVSYLQLMLRGDEVDDLWKTHVSKVISDSSVTNTVSTSQIFPRLYRVRQTTH